ncbi:hypothetical protein NW755_003519 [Fusarium falciforme]|uniref:Clr5 domain-containing protein n=1 Tax=Fusarium falciforme TaxID=195108 RepID=A0A9W8REW5_9HYPO|nr:hypothetical protein NW755_003519 [Fusarium falciforme]
MSSHLASLAPRPGVEKPAVGKIDLPIHHSDKEWDAVYVHIERLYVHERRKLRHVMETMETEYNFKATLQMYKKRFTKWGFSKNKPRAGTKKSQSRDPVVTHTQVIKAVPKSTVQVTLPACLKLGASDLANLEFLASIQNWGSSFFDSPGDHGYPCPPSPPASPTEMVSARRYDPESLSFAFRIIVELLKRGKGELAGRLTRKAFLQIEAMLQVEGPLFIWNILEILYYMALYGQTQLFGILLLHLNNLARDRFEPGHPLMQMLHGLRMLLQGWHKDSLPPQASVLHQAWSLNANMIFNNFDTRLLILYYRLVWDSDMVRLPQNKLEDADRWFALLENKIPMDYAIAEDMIARIHPDLLANDGYGREPPKEYEMLKHTSVSAIQHRSTMPFSETKMKIRILSGMLKSRILERKNTLTPLSDIEADPEPSMPQQHPPQLPRFHARIIAYVMKVLVDIDLEMGFDPTIATDRMRSIVAMREYGQSRIGPQTIHELWRLEDLLRQQGCKEEAAQIRQDTYKRLEEYVDDVPVHEV